MLRTLLLGKLSLSIIASTGIGLICCSRPWCGDYSITQSAQWLGVGVFFLALAIGQIVALYFMFRKKQFPGDAAGQVKNDFRKIIR